MVSQSTRTTRSRFSSPQTASNGTTDPVKGTTASVRPDGQRTLKDWLEPPLNTKASYQDAGLMKHGVVENMAPLGTMPKVGLFKKAVVPASATTSEHKTTPTPIRKIIIKRRSPATPATPPVPPPAASTPAPEEDETEEEPEEEEVLGDRRNHRDYDMDESGRPTLTRRSLQSREDLDDDWAAGKSGYKGYSRRSMSRVSAGRLGSISSSSYQQVPSLSFRDLKEQADQVIERAVDEALAQYRYPTAWALRTLYDEKYDDPAFLGLVVRIFHQTAGREDLEEFRRLMAPRKREGKKDNKGCYYFVPPTTNNRFTPHQPKIAPYAHLIKIDLSPLTQATELGNQSEPEVQPESALEPITEPEPRPELEFEVEPKLEISLEPLPQPERVSKRELPEEEVQQEQAAEQEVHVRKKRRSNRHSASTSKMTVNGVNGKVKMKSPFKRRTRRDSQSSTSSLSSARSLTPPEEPLEDPEADAYEVPPSRASPVAESTSNDVAATKQVTKKGRRRSAAPRKSTRGNASSEPPVSKASTPAISQPAASSKQPTPAPPQDANEHALAIEQPYDMPAVVDAPLFPNPNPKKGGKSANGGTVPGKVGKIDENDRKVLLRQMARAVTKGSEASIEQSFARDTPVLDKEDSPVGPAPSSRPRTSYAAAPTRATPTAPAARTTRSGRKRSHEEVEEQASPITVNFAASEAAPSTAANSRAGTPALRPAKKSRPPGVRVKNSPMKKKSGTSAGIPRASGERNSPGAVANREDDNDDYCSSCGGNGELICCDGCTRSFHFACVDPPLIHDSMPADWFCNVCRTSRDPAAFPTHSGAFALLNEKLDAKNSSAFRLPVPVRELFEGVRTGVDGEYEEAVNLPKVPKKKKNDEDAIPDLFRLRDAEGGAVICHCCQKSSSSNRAIIPCGACGLFWHLDCLDPPLANPPVLRTWKCPCHIEEVLSKVPGTLGPAHRFRKIKNASVIKPAFSRGFINNGYIEVDLDGSEDESGWKNVQTYGRTVRLPEKGIKLDFLSRVRENRKGKPIPPLMQGLQAPAPSKQCPIDKATLDHQQAAYNLAQLSGKGTAPLDNLVDVLLAEAEPAVVSLMARANSENLTTSEALSHMDQQGLRAMLAQLEQTKDRIRELLNSGTPEQSSPHHATFSSGATQEQAVRVPSLTHSQATEAESENPVMSQQAARGFGPDSVDVSKEKDLPSPAATDDVMPISKTDMEKTLTPSRERDDEQTSSSPADENTTADDNIPVTPTDSRMVGGDDSVVVKEPQSDKTAVEIEDDGMDLD